MASAPVFLAASIIFDGTRYDWFVGAGPCVKKRGRISAIENFAGNHHLEAKM
jgi:hypothetical protein